MLYQKKQSTIHNHIVAYLVMFPHLLFVCAWKTVLGQSCGRVTRACKEEKIVIYMIYFSNFWLVQEEKHETYDLIMDAWFGMFFLFWLYVLHFFLEHYEKWDSIHLGVLL